MIWLNPDILCVLGAPIGNYTSITPTPPNVIGFIDFTSCHDRLPIVAIRNKSNKHNPLICTLKTIGWNVNPSSLSWQEYVE
jgi:hypothetical protein